MLFLPVEEEKVRGRVFAALAALLLVVGSTGCKESTLPFETIDGITILTRDELHGRLGHLIAVQTAPSSGQERSTQEKEVYLQIFDEDISDAPYIIQWHHTLMTPEGNLDRVAAVLAQSERITLAAGLPEGHMLFEEIVIGETDAATDAVVHHLRVTTADAVFYIGVHLNFSNRVKTHVAKEMAKPFRDTHPSGARE